MQIYLKKFLLAYIIAVTLVGTYFIIRTLFFEQKEIQTKSFPKQTAEDSQEKAPESLKQSAKKKRPFILLPGK